MNSINHYNPTKKQLAILDLLFRFRFATSEQLSQTLNITTATINKRLKLMLELNYIGRNYSSSYIVFHKHASYYLLPEGIKILKQVGNLKKYSPEALRNARKTERLSEKFVEQCLAIFSVHNTFKEQHRDSLRFFTKTQLVSYPHFPESDGYIRLTHEDDETQFFVDVLYEYPFFLTTRKVKLYLKYAKEEAGIWEEKTNTKLPHVLLVCENVSLQKRLVKKMRRSIIDGSMRFYIIAVEDLKNNRLWQDMTDPEKKLPLIDIT